MNRSRSTIILSIASLACEADTRGLDRLAFPDGGRVECRQASPEIEIGLIEGAPRWSPPESVDVSDGLVYLHRDFGGYVRIVELDPRDGSSSAITDPETQAYLIDASFGAALWIEQPLGAMDFAMVHRTGGQTLLRNGESTIAVQDDDGYVGRDLGQVTLDSAAWRSFDGVWRWDRGTDPLLIFSGEPYLDQPSTDSGRVFFTVRGPEMSRIMVQSSGVEPQAYAVGDVAWPAGSGEALFYVEEGRLTKLEIDTAKKTVLHEGPCGPPHADDGRAVAACGGASWPAPGGFIAYYDGVETHELFEDGGYHFAPRLADGRIVWIRYRSPDVVCTPPEPAAGEVRWWDPDISAEPMILGEVGAPCLCCDAYWPPAVIAFDGEIAAWNYALGDELETSFVGWGRVVRREVCGPK